MLQVLARVRFSFQLRETYYCCRKFRRIIRSCCAHLFSFSFRESCINRVFLGELKFLLQEHAEKARTVKQFHFIQWPDHGVPLFFSPLLAFVRRVRAFNPPHDPAGPIVVHCSAGVGRTGTFIVTDAQLQRIDVEGTVDVYGYTLTIRRQRNFMVQTEV